MTGKDADRFNFKVPTLRNVDLTYPYFHDGAADTLGEAVEIMGRMQLGKKFTPEENAKIVAFLKTLTGDQPSFPVADPAAVLRQDPATPSLQLSDHPPYTSRNPRHPARVLVLSQPGVIRKATKGAKRLGRTD